MCGTGKSTARSTAGSRREVSLLAPAWGHRVATPSWAADSQGAEFKAQGRRVCRHCVVAQGGRRVPGAATVSPRAGPVGQLVRHQPGIKLCSLGILFWLTLSLCLSLG